LARLRDLDVYSRFVFPVLYLAFVLTMLAEVEFGAPHYAELNAARVGRQC
jgi:hypothetical protein